MREKLQFNQKTQEKVIKLLLTNLEFIKKTRRFLKPLYFNSKLSRGLAQGVFDFYDEYLKCPNFEQLDKILDTMIEKKIMDIDELQIYVTYLERLFFDVKVDLVVQEALIDEIREFAKKRVCDALVISLTDCKKKKLTSDKMIKYISSADYEIKKIESKVMTTSILDMLHYERFKEVVTCFNIPQIDEALGGGLQRGFFYIILGYTGVGKTWHLIHLGKMAARLGYLVVHIVVETSNKVLADRYKMSMSGETMSSIDRGYKNISELVRKSMLEHSNIEFLDEDEKTAKVDSLEVIITEVTNKYGRKPDLLLIDSLEDYEPPKGKYTDKHEKELETFTFGKNLAKDLNICVVTSVQGKSNSRTVDWAGRQHVAGFLGKVRRATVGVSINVNPKEELLGLERLFIFKNNEGPTGAKVLVKRNLEKGQVVLGSWAIPDWGKYMGDVEKEVKAKMKKVSDIASFVDELLEVADEEEEF